MHAEGLELPGIGTRYVFPTAAGRQVGVIRHRGGGRYLFLYDVDDQDRALSIPLTSHEAATLARLLRGVEVIGTATPAGR